MGEIDLMSLYPIYRLIFDFSKSHNLGFNFKYDAGTFETALIINNRGEYRKPRESENWSDLAENELLFCPDLLDYQNKLIIEYEETTKPQRSAKIIKKGHTEESKRDTKRDTYYKIAGFHVLKIWQDDQDWQAKIKAFLCDHRPARPNFAK